jgi:hypothetical protein
VNVFPYVIVAAAVLLIVVRRVWSGKQPPARMLVRGLARCSDAATWQETPASWPCARSASGFAAGSSRSSP